MTNVAPYFALIFAHGSIRVLAAIAIVIATCFHIGVDLVMRNSPLYALTLPIGAALFAYMLLRSTIITLKQGGIVWRDTFYSLDDLRRGLV